MIRRWGAALGAAILYLIAANATIGLTGLTRGLVSNAPDHQTLDTRLVHGLDLAGISPPAVDSPGATAEWTGVWLVDGGVYDILLESNSGSTWTIDDVLVAQSLGNAVRRTISLAPGFHSIQVRYDVDPRAPRLVVDAAPAGQALHPLADADLKPRLPRRPWLRTVATVAKTAFGWLALAALLWAASATLQPLLMRLRARKAAAAGRETPARTAWTRRLAAWPLLALILVHGALLRLDTVTGRYGPVSSPGWLRAVQTRAIAAPSSIRPASVVWEPEPLYPHKDAPSTHYRSDPYTYLDGARRLTSFYMAQWREPLFLYATKQVLRVLDGQDVAVSMTSVGGSVLAIWFTYLLGATVWSRPAGLLAALALSLDFDVILLASSGWRDDAYMAAFVLCAYLMSRVHRVAGEPARSYRVGRWHADALYVESAALGVAGGLAVLTRIMAVSFLVAGVCWIVLAHFKAWRRVTVGASVAAVVAILTAGPYFINCWRVFGDPLYTFNVHGAIYSAATGAPDFRGSTAAYVRQRIASRPADVLDTVAQGVTTYPFRNKFRGLIFWWPDVEGWVAAAALVGFAILAGTTLGRLLIVIGFTALLPFSLTWTIDPDYRFTLFIYPVQLVAAGVAAVVVARAIGGAVAPGLRWPAPPWRPFAWRPWAGVVGVALLVVWFAEGLSTSFVFAEALTERDDASITAGTRDGSAFGRGWSAPMPGGNFSLRAVTDEATLTFPLPAVADYPATIRLDPFPRPLDESPARLPVIDLLLNGTSIASVQLRFTPGRIGSYEIVLPRRVVRKGTNQLMVRVVRPASAPASGPVLTRPGLTDGDAAAFWYLRVHGAQAER